MLRGLAALAFLLACGCLEQASVPVLPPRTADEATRQRAYERYRLNHDSGLLVESWKRADGEYYLGQLKELAEPYPDTRHMVAEAQLRGGVAGAVAGAGGGLIGFTLADSVGSQSVSDETQTALYATGAGLIALGFCIPLFWHNPMSDFE